MCIYSCGFLLLRHTVLRVRWGTPPSASSAPAGPGAALFPALSVASLRRARARVLHTCCPFSTCTCASFRTCHVRCMLYSSPVRACVPPGTGLSSALPVSGAALSLGRSVYVRPLSAVTKSLDWTPSPPMHARSRPRRCQRFWRRSLFWRQRLRPSRPSERVRICWLCPVWVKGMCPTLCRRALHSTGQQATATIPERPTRPKIRLRHQPQPPRHHLGRRRGSVRRCTPSVANRLRPRRGKRHRHGPWLPSAAPRRAQEPAGHAASRGQCGGRPGVQRRIQHAILVEARLLT